MATLSWASGLEMFPFVGGLGTGAWKGGALSPSRLAFGFGAFSSSSSVEGDAVLGVEDLKPGLRDDLGFWVSAVVLGVHLLPCSFTIRSVLLSPGCGSVLHEKELEGVPWLPEILREALPSIVLSFSASGWVLGASELGAGAAREELCTGRAFVTGWAPAEEAF